jgi:hypothetical protein
MKIRPVGADLLHADGLTDMTKLTVAFRNFANAPKKGKKKAHTYICRRIPYKEQKKKKS